MGNEVIIYAILGGSFGLGWCWSTPPPRAAQYVVLVAYEPPAWDEPIDFEETTRYAPTEGMDEICALDQMPDPDLGGVAFVRVRPQNGESILKGEGTVKENP